MPVYLLRGFRWLRPAIRIHVILNNLDDAAPEWLVAPATSRVLIENFRVAWPELMKSIPHLRFIEQYNPNDESTSSQPYAYVADTVHEIQLGADVNELVAQYTRGRGQGQSSLKELRDKICMGMGADEKVSWYVVICGDEERSWSGPPTPIADTTPSRRSNGTWFDDVGARSDTPTPPATAHIPSTDRATESPAEDAGSPSSRKRSKSISKGFRRLLGRSDGNPNKADSLSNLDNPSVRSFHSSRARSPSRPPPPGTAR